MTERYEQRKALNEASLAGAEHHAENWSEEEISLLESCWDSIPLEEIAEALGRTIEACRQRHYTIGVAKVKKAKEVKDEAKKKIDVWTRGFTSLDEMDQYYGK